MYKSCTKCKTQQPLVLFGSSKTTKDGLFCWCKPCVNKNAQERRKLTPDKIIAAKRKYYASKKGKACKRREEVAYVASGGRAAAELRRSARPISEARKAARKRWSQDNKVYWAAVRSKRRSLEKELSDDDFWVLQEAVTLARLREKMLGGTWHVDHVIPVSKGGTAHPENLQVVPASWNRQKSNKHSEWFFPRA